MGRWGQPGAIGLLLARLEQFEAWAGVYVYA